MNDKDLEEIKKKLKESAKDLFDPNNAPDFEERGVLSGSAESLEKTDGEQFPDELEEQTPEERRKKFKVHNKEDEG